MCSDKLRYSNGAIRCRHSASLKTLGIAIVSGHSAALTVDSVARTSDGAGSTATTRMTSHSPLPHRALMHSVHMMSSSLHCEQGHGESLVTHCVRRLGHCGVHATHLRFDCTADHADGIRFVTSSRDRSHWCPNRHNRRSVHFHVMRTGFANYGSSLFLKLTYKLF